MSTTVQAPIQNRLQAEVVLGTGTYGQVVRCVDHGTNTRVAVKIAKPEAPYRRSAENEIFVLQNLQHCSRVVKFHDHFTVENRIHIVTELLQKNLYEALKDSRYRRMTLTKVRDVAESVLTAVAELHKIGYMHCDIKPENVMQRGKSDTADDIVMIDFGSVRNVNENQYYDVQSLWYRAPEVMLGLPYSPKIDSWSIGCLLYELHTGVPLFAGENEADSLSLILAVVGRPSTNAIAHGTKSAMFDLEPSPSADRYVLQSNLDGDETGVTLFRDLLVRLLSPDENLRLSTQDALQHPFLAFREGADGSLPGFAGEHSSNSSILSSNWLGGQGGGQGASPASNSGSPQHPLSPTAVAVDEWDCI